MIKLSIDQTSLNKLNKELTLKVEAFSQLTKSSVLDDIARAAFVILGERFMKATDTYSAVFPKKMHHIYEWKQVGNPRARLFVLERLSILNGNLTISSKFLLSKTPVPVPAELTTPNKKGKYVSTRTIFAQKAEVMESGRAVSFQAKKTLAFLGDQGIQFIRAGKIVNVANPGGVGVKNAFTSYMSDWFIKNSQVIMDSSGLYEKIVQETARVLNQNGSGITNVEIAVKQVVDTIATNIMEIK
jgi:hypothetical protein